MTGDSLRIRHDKIKTVINGFCLNNNLRAECEVFVLFNDLIPSEALGQEDNLQRGRGRQGLLPDFRLELPGPRGQPEYRLAELKVIGAVSTWYPRNGKLSRKKKGVKISYLCETKNFNLRLRLRLFGCWSQF